MINMLSRRQNIIRELFGEGQKYASVLRDIAFVHGQGDISNSTSMCDNDMALDVIRKELGSEYADVADVFYEKANVLFASNDNMKKTEAFELQ